MRPAGFDCLAYVVQSIATLPGRYDLEVVFRTTLDVAREIMLPGVGTLDATEDGVRLSGHTQDVDWMARYLSSLPWPMVVRQAGRATRRTAPPRRGTDCRNHTRRLTAGY